jgi:hypothetical protein
MAASTPPATTSRPGRRIRAALRSLHPSTVIALILALVLGGAGAAAAANGGNFLLGKANTETATASLANSKGTPLRLSAPSGTAPLQVNRKTLVGNLNAEYLNGFTFDQLAPTGGDGFTPPGTDTPIDVPNGALVAVTGHMSPGVYYVSATAMVQVDTPAGVSAGCWITKGSDPGTVFSLGEGEGSFDLQTAETAVVSVGAGDTLEEWCDSSDPAADAYNAAITAIRVLFFAGTPPARTGVPRTTVLRGLAHPRAHGSQPGR